MKEKNHNFKKTGWQKVTAVILAMCLGFTSMAFSTHAAGLASNVKGQSSWDGSEDIVLSEEELVLAKDETVYLDVYYANYDDEEDYEYYDMDVTWSSDNRSVASISADGEITAKKAGTATITAETEYGATASCDVIVAEVKLNRAQITVQAGQSTTALVIQSRYPKYDKVDEWVSENDDIAVVNKSGKITGKKKGTTTVTVTMKSGAEASCKVVVQPKQAGIKKLKFSKKKLFVAKGSKTPLTITKTPRNSKVKIKWTSSAPKVVKVTPKGIAIAKKTGKVTITAKAPNGVKASCKIIVKKPAITLKKSSVTLKVGKSASIKVKSTFPKKDKIKLYKSNNPKVASVDAKGKVTAKSSGQAIVTVITKSGAKAIFTVNVK